LQSLSLQSHPGLGPVSTQAGQGFSFPGPRLFYLRARPFLVVIAIIMEAVVSLGAHIEASMVPMAMSLTDPNPDASDPDIDVFRNDNWFVADIRRAGKCRHR
jgi:hypothetical protein